MKHQQLTHPDFATRQPQRHDGSIETTWVGFKYVSRVNLPVCVQCSCLYKMLIDVWLQMLWMFPEASHSRNMRGIRTRQLMWHIGVKVTVGPSRSADYSLRSGNHLVESICEENSKSPSPPLSKGGHSNGTSPFVNIFSARATLRLGGTGMRTWFPEVDWLGLPWCFFRPAIRTFVF